jgi:hypothetical protein
MTQEAKTGSMKLLCAFGLLPLVVSCSSGGTGRPARLADGGYSLSCKGPLTDCLRHAERLCKDQGYTVQEARDVLDKFGPENGQSQVVVEKSDATIHCGKSTPQAPIRLERETELAAPPAVAPAPAAAPPAPPAPAAARACVPGSTQACIGPAGCSGGQACAADGTRFEPCNCGSAASAPVK